MVHEVITINVGECGIQFGHTVWKQYFIEHGIDKNGATNFSPQNNNYLETFLPEHNGRYLTRGIMVDTEPDIIDTIRTCDYKQMYHPEFQFINSNENCASNFTRGHYTIGKEIIDKVHDRIRRLCDNCDNIQGFIINFAVGGGTGSGLGCLILERIMVDYKKKSRIGFHVYPFNNHHSKIVIEPYNALLTSHCLLDYTQLSVVFENNKLYTLCKNNLNIPSVTFNDMNLLMAKVQSSFTAPIRYTKRGINGLAEWQTKLVRFPRLHFIIPSLAPLINKWKFSQILVDGYVRLYYPMINMESTVTFEHPLYKDVMELIYGSYVGYGYKYGNEYGQNMCLHNDNMYEMCVSCDNFMIESDGFDASKDLYMALMMNCHGDINDEEASENMTKLKSNNNVRFVGWNPTGLNVELHENRIGCMDEDTIVCNDNVVMFGNNTFIMNLFNGIAKKYDKMHSQYAYCHWYFGEGLPKYEFYNARDDLELLKQEYTDVLISKADDDEQD